MPEDSKKKQVASDITQTLESQDKTVLRPGTTGTPAKDSQPGDSYAEPDPEDGTKPGTVAGFGVTDLLKAPLRPPKPEVTEGRKATANSKVLVLVAAALALCAVGIILAVTGLVIPGVILLVLAALVVVGVVFLPIR